MKITKADIGLFIIFFIMSLISFVYVYNMGKSTGEQTVIVSHDGEVVGKYPISIDRQINVDKNGHTNKINIKDGNVQMTFSTCQNQDCIRQGKIHDGSKSIICLPNKIVVEVKSEESQFDSVAK